MKLERLNVKETIIPLKEINNDVPSNEEVLSELFHDLIRVVKDPDVEIPPWTTKKETIKFIKAAINDLII